MSHSSDPAPAGVPFDDNSADLERLADRFSIHEVIGRGATSQVRRATQLGVQREVALKLIQLPEKDEDDQRGRMLREARLVAGVHHPGLAQVYDCGVVGRTAFIAIEYLRGATLDDKLRAGAMPIAEALRLSRELVSVLKAVHEHGYIHRDLKPANIFLVPGDDGLEHIKVIDFGVARRISLSAQDSARLKQTLRGIGEKHTVQTMRGIIFGTPAYMSPEQAMGLTLGARSDLYALGCVMYEMLTGTAPFETKEVMKALWDHIAVPPQSLRERTPDAHIPEELDALVLKLLRKKPAERFKDAAAVLTALDVAAGVLPRTALAKTETQRPAAPAAAPGWPKLVAVALLVACASVALVLWLSKPTAPAEVARPATSAPPPIHQHAGPEITPAVDTSEAPEPTPAASVSVAPTAAPTHPNHSIPYGNTQPSPTSKTPATHNPQPTPDPNYELPELRGVK